MRLLFGNPFEIGESPETINLNRASLRSGDQSESNWSPMSEEPDTELAFLSKGQTLAIPCTASGCNGSWRKSV